MKLLLFSLAGLLFLALAGGYLGFRHAFCRRPDPDWDDQQALDRSPEWRNHPISIPAAGQWLREHDARDVAITSFDGLTLRGKWVSAEHPRATIILVHGYRSHYLSDFGGIFQKYHDLGLNLLLIRQRAHGESEGKYITFGVRERMDVLRWIEYHNRTFGKGDVFLGGMSMGAATVTYAAGETLPENVRGITADCGFTSPADIIGRVIRTDFHLPPKPVLPLLELYARLIAGFSLFQCSSAQSGRSAKTPILMIHGKADALVPWQMAQAGYDAYAGEKELILVEGAGHGMSYLTEPERLTCALIRFFERNLTAKLEETT